MAETLRYGIIGTGMMGLEHIFNVNHLDGAEVTAIADPAESSRAAGLTAAGNHVAVFDDHRDLLAADICDALVIATPNMTHHEVLMDVLDTDAHVLVEKPLCTTVADCVEVAEKAQGRKGIVWVGLEYRYMPPVARLIEEVEKGTLGRLSMLAIREHRFPFLSKVDDWNRFRVNTGGTMVEKSCHFFDLMHHIIGSEPVRVMASGSQSVNHLDETYDGRRPDILDNAYVIVEFENDARAMLDLCMFAEATYNQTELTVVGSEAKVEALIPQDVVRIGRRGEHYIGLVEEISIESDHIPFMGGHRGASFIEHQRFLESLRRAGTSGEADPAVSLRNGVLSVAIGVAAQVSIDEERPVLMSEVMPTANRP